MSDHKWQFAPRFRSRAFGWRSDLPIRRIKEAVSEIKQVARKQPALAAEGAVKFLEKISPALEQVDSSSGAIGTAVNRAIEALVPVVATAGADDRTRQRWLQRLWDALQADAMPYIEELGDYWGELCATPAMASAWADEFLPQLVNAWRRRGAAGGYFKGTSACMASLHGAGRYEELLALIDTAPFQWWHDRRWGVQALAAMGKKAEAIAYAEASRGLNNPGWQIAQVCEAILLASGLVDEAYRRYALEANQGTTHLATFRAIVGKYPDKSPEAILRDLVASTPNAEGKWFAAAKHAALFDMAIELAARSPTDPRTLARAARDYADERPNFAIESGLAALRWIALGHGYDVTGGDVLGAYLAVMKAASAAGVANERVKVRIREVVSGDQPGSRFVRDVLGRHLVG